MRGATRRQIYMLQRHRNFNPRSSCEERLYDYVAVRSCQISIHAPHARSDSDQMSTSKQNMIFQSTLLMRGATWAVAERVDNGEISIHAPHARSDVSHSHLITTITIFQSTLLMRGATIFYSRSLRSSPHFNPRSSCEERPSATSTATEPSNFNPRSSCEERPGRDGDARQIGYISIHAPHARSDVAERIEREKRDISIHAPHARSDFAALARQYHFYISIHAPHARSDISHRDSLFCPMLFQSTLLMRGAT